METNNINFNVDNSVLKLQSNKIETLAPTQLSPREIFEQNYMERREWGKFEIVLFILFLPLTLPVYLIAQKIYQSITDKLLLGSRLQDPDALRRKYDNFISDKMHPLVLKGVASKAQALKSMILEKLNNNEIPRLGAKFLSELKVKLKEVLLTENKKAFKDLNKKDVFSPEFVELPNFENCLTEALKLTLAPYEEKHAKVQVDKMVSTVGIQTFDGANLNGIQIINDKQKDVPPSQQKWMLCFLGRDDAMANRLPELSKLSELTGVNILTIDYRGVGDSKDRSRGLLEEHLISDDLKMDGTAAAKFLMHRGIDTGNMMAYGFSQGGAIAAHVASLYQKEGHEMHLCLDRTFTSYKDAARELVASRCGQTIGKMAAASIAPWWNFNTEQLLPSLKGHVVVVEHAKDEIVREGARLQKAAKKVFGETQSSKLHLINHTEVAPVKDAHFFASAEGIGAHNAALIKVDEHLSEAGQAFVAQVKNILPVL